MSISPLLSDLIESLKKYDPLKVYLFGSCARGEDDDLSDIDIVIIKETELGFFDRLREVVRFLSIPKAVDALVYTPEEFGKMQADGNIFVETILEEGLLIYERK